MIVVTRPMLTDLPHQHREAILDWMAQIGMTPSDTEMFTITGYEVEAIEYTHNPRLVNPLTREIDTRTVTYKIPLGQEFPEFP